MLTIRRIDHHLARQAVIDWHYSRRMPGVSHRYGVWEDDRYVGCVLYGRGAAPLLGQSVGVGRLECWELSRVALDRHTTPTTRIVAISLRLLAKDDPTTRVVVSFADTSQGHDGVIYRAGNWLYLGPTRQTWVSMAGTLIHPKTLFTRHGTQSVAWLRENVDSSACYVEMPCKHKYAYPFDVETRERLTRQSRPFSASVV